MFVGESYDDLRAMPDEELVAMYNGRAVNTVPGLDFYREELHRRYMVHASDRMESLTATIKTLTWAVLVLTTVSVGVSAAALIVALAG